MKLFLFFLASCLYISSQAQRTKPLNNSGIVAVAKPDSTAILIAELTKRIEKLEQRIQQDEEKLRSYNFTLSVPLNKMQKGERDYEYYYEINETGLNSNSHAVVTAFVKDEGKTVNSIFVKPIYDVVKARWYLRIMNLGLANSHPGILKACPTCGENPLTRSVGTVNSASIIEDLKIDIRWISYKD